MNLESIITTAGYVGLFGIIFAESGLLVGIFFPGDSLLFTAGFLSSQGIFDIVTLVTIFFVAAVTGDSVGYTFGRRVGKKFFTRQHSLFFNPENVVRAQAFYARHGGKTIILARFIPGIRTLAPILAGVADIHYPTFLIYNIVGAVLWTIGLTLLGYYLGSIIPGVDKYLLPIVALIIIVSVLPTVWKLIISRSHRQSIMAKLREAWQKRRQK